MMGVLDSGGAARWIIYRTVLLVFIASSGSLAENKTSNACHGPVFLQQTSNFLFCDPAFAICIQEVRFYEHIISANCPDSEIAAPAPPECCQAGAEQCFWKGNFSEVTKTHNECNETRTSTGSCLLYNGESRMPPMSSCTNGSSVRSIVYICGENGTCPDIAPDPTTPQTTTMNLTEAPTTEHNRTPDPVTTTPVSGVTAEQGGDPEENTAAIIGGSVAGGVALICIIVVAYFTVKKKRSTKYLDNGIPPVVEADPESGGTYSQTIPVRDEKTHM